MSKITKRAQLYLDNLDAAPIVKLSYIDHEALRWSVSGSSTYASLQKFSQRHKEELDVLLIREKRVPEPVVQRVHGECQEIPIIFDTSEFF